MRRLGQWDNYIINCYTGRDKFSVNINIYQSVFMRYIIISYKLSTYTYDVQIEYKH